MGKRSGREKKKTRQLLACSYGREGEKSENKKEGGGKKAEKVYECRIVDFLTHLLQKDPESLIERTILRAAVLGTTLDFC